MVGSFSNIVKLYSIVAEPIPGSHSGYLVWLDRYYVVHPAYNGPITRDESRRTMPKISPICRWGVSPLYWHSPVCQGQASTVSVSFLDFLGGLALSPAASAVTPVTLARHTL